MHIMGRIAIYVLHNWLQTAEQSKCPKMVSIERLLYIPSDTILPWLKNMF